ncbi:hypothetical protein GPA10_05350 [Streptomyces sp. p1417]|uniref:Uncharacterized protein n=1 Tax=Streptomyces typhae TaxID=2681492 RepID=A0A6L6WQ59_9ACTN|nr:hypothetical protein [Streptomyces typhae]MVO84213.1 hypothetical protein [Streptomyces typhae]
MSQGAPVCWDCDQPIRPGEPVIVTAKDSPSAGGARVVLHAGHCPVEE